MIKEDRLKEILSNYEKVSIAVVGDIMLDEYLIGKVERISPEAPVPVVRITEERFVLGGASNVANNISSLSGKSIIYGVVGDDTNGERFIKELESNNIKTDGIIVDKDRPTIIKSRVLSQGQQLLRLDWEKNHDINDRIKDSIINNIERDIDEIDAILLSDYAKGVLTKDCVEGIIELAKKNKKIVIVDPKPSNFSNYKGVTTITPNKKEILDYFQMSNFKSEDNIIECLKKLKEELDLKYVILTRSEEGVSLYDKNDKHEKIPTVAREVYDVTGAGDTFISTYILSLCAGANEREAVILANMASGIVVEKIGTATVTKKEILEFNKLEINKNKGVK